MTPAFRLSRSCSRSVWSSGESGQERGHRHLMRTIHRQDPLCVKGRNGSGKDQQEKETVQATACSGAAYARLQVQMEIYEAA